MAQPAPLMRAGAAHALVRWLEENGRSVVSLLRASGLAPFDLSDPDKIVPMLPAARLFMLAQRAEGPDLGVRIVTPDIFGRLGGLGRALRRGPAIRDSLLTLALGFSRQATHGHLTATPERNGKLLMRHHYSTSFAPEFLHVSHQFSVALFIRLAQLANVADPFPERIEMTPHPEFGLAHLASHFGPSIFPSASGSLMLCVPKAAADAKIGGEPDAPTPEWRSLREPGTLTHSLQLLLREILHDGEPAIGEVAAVCGLSVRTLQRRLAEERTSFAQVFDDVRRDVILELLGAGGNSVSQAGAAAGYASPSAVSRAVKRWTKVAPRSLLPSGSRTPGLHKDTEC